MVGLQIGGSDFYDQYPEINWGYFCWMESASLSHVNRTDDLYRLHHLLEEHGRVLLLGVAGIGKSQLARDYIEFFDLDYRHQTLTLSFSETTYNEIMTTVQTATLDSPILVIIDELNKFHADDRDRVLRFIKTSRHLPVRIVIIGRGNEPEIVPFLSAGISMRLYGLTKEQVYELAVQLRWKNALDEGSVTLYMSLAQTYDGNPAGIHALFEAVVIEDIQNLKENLPIDSFEAIIRFWDYISRLASERKLCNQHYMINTALFCAIRDYYESRTTDLVNDMIYPSPMVYGDAVNIVLMPHTVDGYLKADDCFIFKYIRGIDNEKYFTLIFVANQEKCQRVN